MKDWKSLFKKYFVNPVIDKERIRITGIVGMGPYKQVYSGSFEFLDTRKEQIAVAVFGNHFKGKFFSL